MNKILIDTMHIAGLLTNESGAYFELAKAIKNQKITGVVSVVTLTELIKILGEENMDKINDLVYTKLVFINITQKIAMRAGDIRLKYDIPTIDSLIAATGLVENIKHILTHDTRHFEATKNLIKPVDLKTVLKMAK
ncbi:MAG: PIN domain-containing protein [Candidatus Methanoperedens sp.]